MSDAADPLNAKLLPIPTEQRLDVFVCPGLSDEALARWISQAGQTTFHCAGEVIFPATFCGIALFVRASNPRVRDGYICGRDSEYLEPFYERAGNEANVFEWQPIERNFVRRDRQWFDERRSK